jgi:tetratricopeptide (TPR) repeat protein
MELRREIDRFLLRTRNWDEIADGIKSAIEAEESQQTIAENLTALGRDCWDVMLRGDLAIPCFQKAFQVDATRRDALEQAAAIYWDLGNLNLYGKLLQLALQAVEDEEIRARLQHRLARVLMNQGQWEPAAEALRQAAAVLEQDEEIKRDLAATTHDPQQWQQAVEEIGASSADLDEVGQAAALVRAGRIVKAYAPERAHPYFANALAVDPRNDEARLLVELTYTETDNTEELFSLHAKSGEGLTEPQIREQYWKQLGRIWSQRLEDRKRAAQCFDVALRSAHERGERWDGDLAALEQVVVHGEIEQAQAALKRVHDLELTAGEQVLGAVLDGSFCAFRLQDEAAAYRAFERARALAPEHEEVVSFFSTHETHGNAEKDGSARDEANTAKSGENEKTTPAKREESGAIDSTPESKQPIEEDLQVEDQRPESQMENIEDILEDLQESFDDEQQQLLDEAAKTESEQPERAADAWRKAVNAMPQALTPRLRLALAQKQLERWNSVVDALNDALKKTSEEQKDYKRVILFELIDIYKNHMHLDVKVLECFKKLKKIDPTNLRVLDAMAEHLEGARRYTDLIKVLKQKADVLEAVEDKVAITLRIANLFMDRNNHAEAVKSFEQVLELDPTNEQAIEQLKAMYEKRRDWEKLIGVFEKEIEMAPDDEAKLEGRLSVARLASQKLRRPGVATELWEKVLEFDPQNLEALENLEKFYKREKKWEELAEVCEKQVDLIEDEERSSKLCLELGVLFTDRIKDPQRAIKAWKRLLSIDPDNRRAQDALKKLYIAEKDWQSLEEFYASMDAWDEYIRVLDRQVSQEDPETQLKLYFKIASLWLEKLDKPERAVSSYEKILNIESENLEAAEALIPLFEGANNNKKLVKVLEIQLQHTEDPVTRLERIRRLAELYESKLRNPKSAYAWLLKAFEDAWQEEWIREEIERLAEATRGWAELVEAYEKVFDEFSDPVDSLPLRRVVARVYESELANLEKALEVNRSILEIAPEDMEAVEALERLYIGAQQWEALLEVYQKKLELVIDEEQRKDILLKMAQLCEDELEQPQKAIEYYNGILEMGDNLEALRALDRLYAGLDKWEELADVIERQLVLISPDDRQTVCELKFRLGELRETKLGAPAESLAAYRDILEMDPLHEGARSALEKRLQDEDFQLEVSRILEPIYEEQGEWEQLVRVYEIQVQGQQDPTTQVELLLKIGDLWGQKLGESPKAFDAYRRAFRIDPTAERAREELVKICNIEQNWEQLVGLYEEAVQSELEPGLQRDIYIELAKIQDTQLENWDKAVEAYNQALTIEPDDRDSLEALQNLYTRKEQWAELLEVYRKKADLSADPEERENLFFQMAYLQEEMLGKIQEAIETYREIVTADDTNLKALSALDRLYTQQEAWHELADNLTRQLELTTDDQEKQVELFNRLAALRENQLGEAGAAVETYRKVLEKEPENEKAIRSLEELLDSEEHQLNVAQILEPIYRMRDDWQKLVQVYEVMVKNTFDPVRKLELLHSIGELYEIAGDNAEAAFKTYGRALAEDPANEETRGRLERLSREIENWSDLVSLYTEQAENTVDTALSVGLYTRVAQILETQMDDLEKAAQAYHKVLEIDPDRMEAADALEQIFIRMDDSNRLVEILLKKSEMSQDLDERKQLCYRAAKVEEEVLEDAEKAIAIYNRVLEMDESDTVALEALEGLYVRLEKWENLKDVYIKKAELAPTDEDRKKMLYVLGQVYDVELQDADKAIETFRSILDIDPEDLQAIQSLDRLYEATENWYELLSILEREEELAEGSAEVVGLKHRIGSLWEKNLEDLTRAVEAYQEVLTMDPTHEPTLQALDRVAHGEKEPVLAAQVLEPVYREGMEWEKLVDIYEVMVKSAEENERRVELLHQIANLYEQQIESPKQAFEAFGRALEIEPSDEQTIGQLERLAEQIQAWDDLAKLYEEQLEKILDSQLQISMLLKVARVYEEELGQPDNAVAKYERALEHDPECRPAILSLDRLFESMERWKDLADVLQREIRMAASDDEMVGLQFRLGQLYEQNLQDMDNAIETYRDILTTVPGHQNTLAALELLFAEGVKQQEIAEILEPFYTDHGHWDKLVKILEVQLDFVQDLMDRMEAIQRIAEIYENQLQDNVESFRWWGRAYLEDPTSELVVEEMERLAADTASWEECVEVYEKAAAARQDDPNLVKQILLRKARICEQQTHDHAQWEEALQRVLQIDEDDGEALAGLDRLYTQAQMYEELAQILKKRVQVNENPDEVIDFHFRLAEIYEHFLEDFDAAVAAYQAVLEEEMRNVKALEGLEKIYFSREQWQELYGIYEKMLDVAAGDSEMADCYARMAKIASEALEDAEDAKSKWHQVLDLRGEDPLALSALADLYEEAQSWNDLVEILERQVDVMEEPQDRIAIYERLGRIHHQHLDQDREAMDAYHRILEIDPSNMSALWSLAELYRLTQAWEELSQTLYELVRLGSIEGEMSDEQLLDLYAQLGELQGNVLMRPDDAIDAWRRVLDLDPANFKALGELEKLFTQEARWEECVEVLERKVNVLAETTEKIDVLLQIANIWEDKVSDPAQAAAVYERILEIDPAHMLASGNLENIYRENWEYEKLVAVLFGRVEHLTDADSQVETLQSVAKIYEENFDPPNLDSAFDTLLFAFELDYTNETTAAELERLAAATNRWNDLLTKYNEKVAELTDVEVKCELLVKVGKWYGSKLNHPEYAIASLQQALQLDQNNRSALAGLGDFYRSQGQWGELAQVLSRRTELEEDPEILTGLHQAMGELYEDKLSNMMDPNQAIQLAIGSYQKALRADEANTEAIAALERLYRQHQQWEQLIEILKKKAELTTETDTVIDIKYAIGELYEDRLDDAYRAIESYKEILTVDPQHLPALRSLEKLYEKTGQMEEYLDVLEQQLDYVGSDDERITKYNQMAAVWEEHFDKIERATECYEKILLIDERHENSYRNLERLYRQDARWDDLVDTYEKHINAINSPAERMQLFRLMGEIYERELQDPDRAIDAYRAILDYDDDHSEALSALGRLYEQVSDWDNALEVLSRLVRLVDDPTQQVEIYHRLGHILEEAMNDVAGAEEQYVRALELDPAYVPSMNALTEIYKGRNDWMKAAKMMVTAEEHTNNILERTRLLKDAGVIYLQHLEDREQAMDLLSRAIELDPENVEAARPLSELYFEDERYEELETILDMLVRKSEGEDNATLNALYYRAGHTNHKLGKLDKALKYYQMAYDLDSTHLPTLKGMAEILYEQKEWNRSFKIFQTMLVHHREDQSSAEITNIFYRLGNIKLELGERKKALNMYEKALEVDPSHRDTLLAVIDLQEKQQDWDAVIHAKRALVQSADEDEQFKLLEEIGDIYNDKLSNPQKSIAAYQESLEVNPGSHHVLQKLMERYYATKQWKKAIGVIDKFIEMESDPKIRYKYSYAAATVYRDELKALDESIEYFNRTLDDNWEHLKAFEAIDKLCTQKRDWKTLERNYRKMIKRVSKEENPGLVTMLWHGLGEIYRSRMRNYESAIAAFDVAAQLEPGNIQRHQILAELYEAVGTAEALNKAVGEYQAVLKSEPTRVEVYQKLFQLYHNELREYDKAWCVAQSLAFYRKAEAQEMRLFEQYRQEKLVRAKQRMGDEMWNRCILHADENRIIGALFAIIAPALAYATGRPLKQYGLKRKDARPLATDNVMFTRLFNYVLQVLNIQVLPDLYLRMDQSGGLMSGTAVEKNNLIPFCIAGGSLLQGRSDKELAFAIAKELSYFRPEHLILRVAQQITAGQLKILLLAALRLVNPKLNLPGVDPGVLDQQARVLQKHVQPSQMGLLASLAKKLMANPEAVDLTSWLNAVDASANRTGFVICNDLPVAANMIRLSDRAAVPVGGKTIEEKLQDLVHYSVSEEYFDIRKQLGLQIGQQ